MQVQIGELAKRSDCKVVTIRYYEKEGLLPEPLRSSGNYRLYDEGHLERLQFIRHCRSLDMSLEEIKTILGLRAAPARLRRNQCHARCPHRQRGRTHRGLIAFETAFIGFARKMRRCENHGHLWHFAKLKRWFLPQRAWA